MFITLIMMLQKHGNGSFVTMSCPTFMHTDRFVRTQRASFTWEQLPATLAIIPILSSCGTLWKSSAGSWSMFWQICRSLPCSTRACRHWHTPTCSRHSWQPSASVQRCGWMNCWWIWKNWISGLPTWNCSAQRAQRAHRLPSWNCLKVIPQR